MPERKRRTLWKTALKALAAAVGLIALLLVAGLILASTPVRGSALGHTMERRCPIGWSRIALVFGDDDERAHASWDLSSTGSGRALPALERAAHDRAPLVSSSAVTGIATMASHGVAGAQTLYLRLGRDPRPDVRASAYTALRDMRDSRAMWQRGGEGQRLLTQGLRDPDPRCRDQAARTAVHLCGHRARGLWRGELDPQVLRALRDCLRGPAPRNAVDPRTVEALGARVASAHSFEEFHRSSKPTNGPPPLRVQTALGLWELDTAEARHLLQEELAKHPLTNPQTGGG